MVDVVSEIVIQRPRVEVAAYVLDPDNVPQWYENIKAVEWHTAPPIDERSRFDFVARVLGGPLTYTYEVLELVPGERLVMHTADGPFPMDTTYTFEDAGDGATRMTLRNAGEAKTIGKLSASVIAPAMRRANRKDLKRLKRILEA